LHLAEVSGTCSWLIFPWLDLKGWLNGAGGAAGGRGDLLLLLLLRTKFNALSELLLIDLSGSRPGGCPGKFERISPRWKVTVRFTKVNVRMVDKTAADMNVRSAS
jgi:hypothetical protein